MSGEPLEPQELSEEERRDLDTIRSSGMTTAELLARARRDYERESEARGQGGGGQPDPGDEEDDSSIVTRGELREMMGTATNAAAQDVAKKTVKLAAMEDEIARVLGETTDFKNPYPDEIETIKGLVAGELGKLPKLRELDQVQLRQKTREAATYAIGELRKRYRQRAGLEVEDDHDRDSRLAGSATGETRGGADTGGRGGGRPSPKPGKPGSKDDVPVESLCGLGGEFPSLPEIESQHQRRLREWTAEHSAGR